MPKAVEILDGGLSVGVSLLMDSRKEDIGGSGALP